MADKFKVQFNGEIEIEADTYSTAANKFNEWWKSNHKDDSATVYISHIRLNPP